jgi:hypothetical protein
LETIIPKEHVLYQESEDDPNPSVLICNKCGKQAAPYTVDHFTRNLIHQILSLKFWFHYKSERQLDGWSFEVCEKCLLNWISTFEKHPAGFGSESDGMHHPENPDQLFQEWKERKKIAREIADSIEETDFKWVENHGVSLLSITDEKDIAKKYMFSFPFEEKVIEFGFLVSPDIDRQTLHFNVECYETVERLNVPFRVFERERLDRFIKQYTVAINEIYVLISEKILKSMRNHPQYRMINLYKEFVVTGNHWVDLFLKNK